MKSGLYTLKWRDFFRSLIMAGLTPVFYIIQQSVVAQSFVLNWKGIGYAAGAGMLGYLAKNFFTDDVKAAEKTLIEASKVQPSAPKDQELNPPKSQP